MGAGDRWFESSRPDLATGPNNKSKAWRLAHDSRALAAFVILSDDEMVEEIAEDVGRKLSPKEIGDVRASAQAILDGKLNPDWVTG